MPGDATSQAAEDAAGCPWQPPGDDYRDTLADGTAPVGWLPVLGSVGGRLEVADDTDVFAVCLTAGEIYLFDLEGAARGLELRDGSGTVLHSQALVPPADLMTYNAWYTGLHYMTVSGGMAGDYTLIARQVTDDYRDTPLEEAEPLGQLLPGVPVTGSIEQGFDTDIFAVTLVGGRDYVFADLGVEGDGVSARIGIYDPAGEFIRPNDYGTSSIAYTALESGTYFIGMSDYRGNTGGYRLSVEEAADDYRDTPEDESLPLGRITSEAEVAGRLETFNDTDVFALNLEAGADYVIGMAVLTDTLPSLRMVLRDAEGVEVASGETSLEEGRLGYTPAQGGTFYLTASQSGGQRTADYSLTLRQTTDDFADTLAEAGHPIGTLAAGGSAFGEIGSPDDVDLFAVTLEAGQEYQVTMQGGQGQYLPGLYPVLKLLDASGAVLQESFGYESWEASLLYTAQTSGSFHVSAASNGQVAPYTVRLAAVGDVYRDAAWDETRPYGQLTVGGAVQSRLDVADDVDLFAVTLEAGQTYAFDLTGAGQDFMDSLRSPLLVLTDANGGELGRGDGRVAYTAASSGTYYLAAQAYSGDLGAYGLAAERVADGYANSLADMVRDRGRLEVGHSVSGRIDVQGDTDLFAINLTAGQSYVFDLIAREGAAQALAESHLDLLDATGGMLASDDAWSGGRTQVTYTAATDGPHYLLAGSSYGLTMGAYTLKAAGAEALLG